MRFMLRSLFAYQCLEDACCNSFLHSESISDPLVSLDKGTIKIYFWNFMCTYLITHRYDKICFILLWTIRSPDNRLEI